MIVRGGQTFKDDNPAVTELKKRMKNMGILGGGCANVDKEYLEELNYDSGTDARICVCLEDKCNGIEAIAVSFYVIVICFVLFTLEFTM